MCDMTHLNKICVYVEYPSDISDGVATISRLLISIIF